MTRRISPSRPRTGAMRPMRASATRSRPSFLRASYEDSGVARVTRWAATGPSSARTGTGRGSTSRARARRRAAPVLRAAWQIIRQHRCSTDRTRLEPRGLLLGSSSSRPTRARRSPAGCRAADAGRALPRLLDSGVQRVDSTSIRAAAAALGLRAGRAREQRCSTSIFVFWPVAQRLFWGASWQFASWTSGSGRSGSIRASTSDERVEWALKVVVPQQLAGGTARSYRTQVSGAGARPGQRAARRRSMWGGQPRVTSRHRRQGAADSRRAASRHPRVRATATASTSGRSWSCRHAPPRVRTPPRPRELW